MKKLLLVILLVGCVTPPAKVKKKTKKLVKTEIPVLILHSKRSQGCGVAIGQLTILTVEHVAKVAKHVTIRNNRYGVKINGKIKKKGMAEALVIMGVKGYAFHSWYELGEGEPRVVVTPRGRFSVEEYMPVPGDSGSPVLDSDDKLVALVSGSSEQVFAAIVTIRKPVFVKVVPLEK